MNNLAYLTYDEGNVLCSHNSTELKTIFKEHLERIDLNIPGQFEMLLTDVFNLGGLVAIDTKGGKFNFTIYKRRNRI